LYEESPSTTQSRAEEIQFRADTLIKALIETSKTILGERKKRKQPSWIRVSTTALVEQQEQANFNYKQAPTTSNKEIWHALQEQVDTSYSKDQEDFMNSQLKDLELAAQKREYGTIWQLVNQIAGQNKKPVLLQ
jgi:hypothetical protein